MIEETEPATAEEFEIPTWEYLVVRKSFSAHLQAELTELGQQGWELVALTGMDGVLTSVGGNKLYAIMKRPGRVGVKIRHDATASTGKPPRGSSTHVKLQKEWWRDPLGRHPDRYWDGSRWTQWVRDKAGGTRAEDPFPSTFSEGWYVDPTARHPQRWWDGASWTVWVRDSADSARSVDEPD